MYSFSVTNKYTFSQYNSNSVCSATFYKLINSKPKLKSNYILILPFCALVSVCSQETNSLNKSLLLKSHSSHTHILYMDRSHTHILYRVFNKTFKFFISKNKIFLFTFRGYTGFCLRVFEIIGVYSVKHALT